jgi:hypothetical protein
MDDLIQDAQNKHLIEFVKVKPFYYLMHLFMGLKDMSKLPELDLEIYWQDYIMLHIDWCGFTNEDED